MTRVPLAQMRLICRSKQTTYLHAVHIRSSDSRIVMRIGIALHRVAGTTYETNMKRNKGLGRGLDALLGGDNTPTAASTGFLPLDQLRPGKYQPRTRMNTEALRELAESI